MLSLSEITLLEDAYNLGLKSLGESLEHLLERWNSGLKDDETFIRAVFLIWYSQCETSQSSGLPENIDISLEDFISEVGGVEKISSENQFVIAVLALLFAFHFGDEEKWTGISRAIFLSLSEKHPESAVFSNWQYLLLGSDEVSGLRRNILPELNARFKGRGEMGRYLIHILSRSK